MTADTLADVLVELRTDVRPDEAQAIEYERQWILAAPPVRRRGLIIAAVRRIRATSPDLDHWILACALTRGVPRLPPEPVA